jgi:hypothetical protein
VRTSEHFDDVETRREYLGEISDEGPRFAGIVGPAFEIAGGSMNAMGKVSAGAVRGGIVPIAKLGRVIERGDQAGSGKIV